MKPDLAYGIGEIDTTRPGKSHLERSEIGVEERPGAHPEGLAAGDRRGVIGKQARGITGPQRPAQVLIDFGSALQRRCEGQETVKGRRVDRGGREVRKIEA